MIFTQHICGVRSIGEVPLYVSLSLPGNPLLE